MKKTPIYSFIGWSGAGKTTFLEKLIAHLKQQGIRVALIKEIPKVYTLDTPGKDTYRLAQAGAETVWIANPESTVMMCYRPMTVAEMIAMTPDVDLILTEGHHHLGFPQIEVYRSDMRQGLRCPDRSHLIGVVTEDELPPEVGVRRFSSEDVQAVADFMLREYPLRPREVSDGRD